MYHLIITTMRAPPPHGNLDGDRAALESAHVPYKAYPISVY
jgi:hypothetical protein